MNKTVSVFAMSVVVAAIVVAFSPHASAAGKCPEATKVTITSTNGAYPKGLSWDKVQTVVANVDKSLGRTSAFFYIGNFAFSGNPEQVKPGDGQGILYLLATSHDPKVKDVKLKPGKFNFADYSGTALQRGEASIRVKGGSSVQLNTDNEGFFELTSVTDKEICGRFDLKDKWTRLSGEFRAPVK